jgi:hypothetical protein
MSKVSLNTARLQQMRAQLYAMGEPCPELYSYLRTHTLDLSAIHALTGMLAVCLCRSDDEGECPSSFTFAEGGIPSIVIEVLGADGATVIDLVAWPIHAPDCFATAIAESDMLGMWNMISRGGLPLPVHQTPHDWLVAGCQGCVPLNLTWAGHWLAKAGGPFISHDLEHGRELRSLLGSTASSHSILVRHSDERRVA